MKYIIGLKIINLLFLAESLSAQTIVNTIEASNNQKEIEVTKAELDRDLRELNQIKTNLIDLEIAIHNGNLNKVNVLRNEVIHIMQREINQSEQKIKQARKEVSRSNSELNASRRETRRTKNTAKNNGIITTSEVLNIIDDKKDQNDDRRDLSDDRSDLQKQILLAERQKTIFSSLKNVVVDDSFSSKLTDVKKLIHQFVNTMEADIASSLAELSEDKKETQEDRRERVEDRRVRIKG